MDSSDHENIKIKSDCLSLQDSLQFIKSNENILHFQFLKKESEFQQKLALLDPIVNNFPKEDKFLSRSIRNTILFKWKEKNLLRVL